MGLSGEEPGGASFDGGKKAREIEAIAVYPEHRLAYHPTTAKIFDRFHDTSVYRVMRVGELEKQYRDELSEGGKFLPVGDDGRRLLGQSCCAAVIEYPGYPEFPTTGGMFLPMTARWP